MKHTKTMFSTRVKDREINRSVLLNSMQTDVKVSDAKNSLTFGNAASNLFSVTTFTLVVYMYIRFCSRAWGFKNSEFQLLS